jgi:recombination protein RecA
MTNETPRARVRPAPATASDSPAPAAPRKTEERVDPLNARGELGKVVSKVHKRYGQAAAMRASMRPTYRHVSTGVYLVDLALLGGIPAGTANLFTGWQGSGKTTMAMRATAGFQRRFPDQAPVYVDVEGTFDPLWARKHGVDTDRLLLLQPTCAEDALDIANATIRAAETSLLVMDSLAALIPTKEVEIEADKHVVGDRARMIRRYCHQMTQAHLSERARGHWPTVLNINQYTMQVGVMYGDPKTMPGGMAPKYQASTWLEWKNKEARITRKKDAQGDDAVNDYDMVSHNDHSFLVKKSKIGSSITTGEFELVRSPFNPLGEGFVNDAKSVLVDAKRRGFVTGGGSHWRMDGVDGVFSSGEEMVYQLYSDLEYFEDLKIRLISAAREQVGMVHDPKDWA